MIRVGIAGIGFMGMIHYLAYQRLKGVKVVALCEQDATRLAGDWRTIKGNFGPQGEMMDLSGIRKYASTDELVRDEKLDIIDICLPPAAHASVAIKALTAGKHVFCEKPIALKGGDARRMVDTAKRYKRLLFIGHVLPFFPAYRWAYETVAGGKLGKPLGGHFKRIISDPLWLKDFYDPRKIGGPMLDLHVHDAHFIRLLFGMPKAVATTGRMRGEVAEFFSSQFVFDDPALGVTATSGVIRQQGRPFTNAFEIHLEKGTLLFDFAVLDSRPETLLPPSLLSADGKVIHPQIAAGDEIDAFAAELAECHKCLRSGRASKLLDGSLASDALLLCERQTASLARGRMVRVA